MTKPTGNLFLLAILFFIAACGEQNNKQADSKQDSAMVRLAVLDPGHFHAALVQKTGYSDIDTNVFVYAPEGEDLNAYNRLVQQYNSREAQPTKWNTVVYSGSDFAEKMLQEKKGNVVVLSGNNKLKTDYIRQSIDAGLNVLADKPMAIDENNFKKLQQAFETAEKKKVLLYDIMTERSEITNLLQRELIHTPALFGELQKGSAKDPAVYIESIHYFFKNVSGKPLVRPTWFFDPKQQGDAIADVGTHLVDLVQWECFPDTTLDYTKDLNVYGGRIWPTPLTPSQFSSITGKTVYPDFLKEYVTKDSILNTHGNGEMDYALKGVHVKIIVRWDYKAEQGGDSHLATVKGTTAIVEIRQTKTENFKPVLYIKSSGKKEDADFEKNVKAAIASVEKKYPGVTVEKVGSEWKVIVPTKYDIGHEAHFGQVMERYLGYLKNRNLPAWEVSNMISKYYTTTKALELATGK